jgi:WD40 repeat protein
MRIIQSENPRPLNRLALGPGGLVAAASATFGAPGDVEVWDAASGARRFVYREPTFPLMSLVFHPNGRTLIFSRQGAVFALDPAPGEVTRDLIHSHDFPDVAVSPDGARLLVSENQETALQTTDGSIACYTLGPRFDLTRLWVVGSDSVPLFHPAFNGDGSRFAVTARDLSGARVRNAVQLRDSTGKLLVTIPTDAASPIHQLAFTADGSKLLARTDGRTVQLYDATTGAAAGELVHAGRPFVTGMAVHPRGPTGRSVAACCRTNGTVCLWDVEKREQLRTFDWKAGRLVSVAFSPDGALAAVGTEDGKVVVWDVDL